MVGKPLRDYLLSEDIPAPAYDAGALRQPPMAAALGNPRLTIVALSPKSRDSTVNSVLPPGMQVAASCYFGGYLLSGFLIRVIRVNSCKRNLEKGGSYIYYEYEYVYDLCREWLGVGRRESLPLHPEGLLPSSQGKWKNRNPD